MHNLFHSRWKLALKTSPLVGTIVICKLAAHFWGFEFLSLNSLFTAVVSANIFLIGFLISGVLVDYKESEKIPAELASSMENMSDEAFIIYGSKKSPEAAEYLKYISGFCQSLIDWFYKKERTESLLSKLAGLNAHFASFEKLTQANFIARLKQEQGNIRRIINRVHTIRETSFLGTGYAIVEIISFVLIVGMVFIKIDPFYESVFFVSFVSFILIYMIYFIKDLDNPFGYSLKESLVEDVSLKPITDFKRRIDSNIDEAIGQSRV